MYYTTIKADYNGHNTKKNVKDEHFLAGEHCISQS